jgi:hypothetical protein
MMLTMRKAKKDDILSLCDLSHRKGEWGVI